MGKEQPPQQPVQQSPRKMETVSEPPVAQRPIHPPQGVATSENVKPDMHRPVEPPVSTSAETAVQPAAAPSFHQRIDNTQRPAQELLDYLKDTGSPTLSQELIRTLIAENPKATAEQAYLRLTAGMISEESQGTFRKASVWVWGEYRPDGKTVEDNVYEKMQTELATTLDRNRTLAAENNALKKQLVYQQERIHDLESRNEYERRRGSNVREVLEPTPMGRR